MFVTDIIFQKININKKFWKFVSKFGKKLEFIESDTNYKNVGICLSFNVLKFINHVFSFISRF